MIRAERVSKTFSSQVALKDVSFKIEKEKVAVLGKNGAGKTTLLKIIAGILRPSHGRMYVFDSDPAKDPEVRRKIGAVFQNPMLYSELTVEENLKFFSKLYGCELNEEILEILDIKKKMNFKISELSAGWVKRISIAKAFMHDPKIVLIDELPALDFEGKSRVFDLLKKFDCLIYVTHETEELKFFNRFLVLRDGKLVYDGRSYDEAISFY
ncbi:MAG: ABC transporter ATP-binding protein [Archaeoglobaceae archaeon]|nr:ABC transporter ATP-binding protein [Archaeoglobaceae archaeon]MCX8151855.1 ABC transporter ATP-binding protein [Archaeoglobaceae archaeon]MDW8014313.1 ABC transporter ATP-binding protein [Archaeoglobaceae archaeon]